MEVSDQLLPQAMDASGDGASHRPSASATRRLVYALTLIPIVPAASVLGVLAIDEWFGPLPHPSRLDEIGWFQLLFSILWVGAMILIWRAAVLWTLGRKWLTALVGLIPFVQVACGQPLWTVTDWLGLSDAMLRVGQHQVSVALWTWLSIWVWWGLEKTIMAKNNEPSQPAALRATPKVKRIVASIGMVPAVVGAFILVLSALDDLAGLSDPVAPSFAFTAMFAIGIWIMIWRKVVIWDRRVWGVTLLSALAWIALPITLQWQLKEYVRADTFAHVALVLLPIIGWGIWLAVTVRHWPMRHDVVGGDALGPRCIRCGYSLRGLCGTRCPECGDEPTLDELWASSAGLDA